jgi:hypothetical protein
MTFSEIQIDELKIVSRQYDGIINELQTYCDIVAKTLGYSYASGVKFDGSTVDFRTHGYDPCNDDNFSFPLAWLTNTPEETGKLVKKQEEEKWAKIKAAQDAEYKENRRKQYNALKAEFEPTLTNG